MAAFAQPTHPASSTPQFPVTPRQLPNGQCYYRDITAGRESIQCACRQFYLNDPGLGTHAQTPTLTLPVGTWCYCGHHACFHEHKLDVTNAAAGIQERENNGIPREWQTAASQAATLHQGHVTRAGVLGEQDQQHDHGNDLQNLSAFARPGLGLFTSNNRLQQFDSAGLNQIYPYNALPDHLPSTQCSRVASAAAQRPRSSPARSYSANNPRDIQNSPHVFRPTFLAGQVIDDQAQSATEMATPSLQGTPALRETDEGFQNLRNTLEAFNRQHSALHANPQNNPLQTGEEMPDQSTPHVDEDIPIDEPILMSPKTTSLLLRQVVALKGLLSSTPNLATSLGSLNNRLEALEAMSFSHVLIEDAHDKFENFDGRMLDVEGKVSELEHATAEVVRRAGRADASFASNASHTSGSQEGSSHIARLDALGEQLVSHQQRLTDLESVAPPSTAHPWEIEVVMLPYGPDLRGLWLPAGSIPSVGSTQDSGTPGPSTQSAATLGIECGLRWRASAEKTLVARACGPSKGTPGRIYERLRSRGLVRNIAIKGNTADHVASAVIGVFQEHLSWNRDLKQTASAGLHGLQCPFIPLRKVHRSPILRFLTAAELSSPALWTAEFLNASVFMHAPSSGLRRLYVTEPAGYVQDHPDISLTTWLKLRELPRFTGRDDAACEEADALEPAWAFDERLDPPSKNEESLSSGLSYHSSFDSHMLSPRQTNPPSEEQDGDSQVDSEAQIDEAFHFDDTGSRPQSPISPLITRTRVPHSQQLMRSVSLPSQADALNLPTMTSKRQLASFDQVPKRRRVSHSPEDVELMGLWSPRRSREPVSPRSARLSRRASMSRGASSKRASTSEPHLAYATPYSADIVMGPDGGMEVFSQNAYAFTADSYNDMHTGDDGDEYVPDASSGEDSDDEEIMLEEEDALKASAASDLGAGSEEDSDGSDDMDDDDDENDNDDWEGMDENADDSASVADMGPEAQTWSGLRGQREGEDEDGIA